MGLFTKKGDAAVLAKLAEAPAPYREIGERLHEIIRENAPSLEPLLRWGIPFYTRDGEDVCYIKSGNGFIVFGFGEEINPAFEEGATLHPVVWSVTSLDAETEARIAELVRRSVA
ncbi:DUF1801 domain-containing protein [Microbacterium gilvum]|uniref:YdhG-like domain-containing protein n=1 Tax=Microbacterium gilvum TaxID=1336204 RepID=A0ABP9APJ3_9MICO